jgi:nickel-dependent lactate racemase
MKVLKEIDVFAIMTVLDRDHDIYAVTSGDLESSFYAAIDKADEVFCVEIPEKAEIVISAAPYPMDIDLYQSQKALDNGKLALKDGGILIMVSQCRTGIGEEAFFKLMGSAATPAEVLEKIKGTYKLGYHKAAKMAEINLRAESWAVTNLTDEEMKTVHLKPYHNLEKAFSEAFEKLGNNAKVIVLPYGSITVPKFKA